MRAYTIAALLAVASAQSQGPGTGFPKEAVFENKPALILANDVLQLTLIRQGGALIDLALRDDPARMSPLWNPMRLARDAGQPVPTSSSMGHFVCVDGFGPASKEEAAAGMPMHGEAHVQPWELIASGRDGATYYATFRVALPLSHETFTRTLRMVDGESVIYVESELENLLAIDRPVCWAEHATISAPFLEAGETVVDMSARRAQTRGYAGSSGRGRRFPPFRDFTWPMAPTVDGGLVDLRAAPAGPDSMGHTASLMDPERDLVFVTALHPGKRLLLGYLFRREEYPWLQNYENYRSRPGLVRGLEFSTQPFDLPRREVIRSNTLFDTPVYRWLPAKSKIGSRFLMFYTRTPGGFTRVDDVRLEPGAVVVEDRSAGKLIRLPASGSERLR